MMKHLNLKLYPHKSLRVICKPVKSVAANHIRIAARMHEVMKQHKGVGLSAPQIGLDLQIITINTMSLDPIKGIRRTIFNPEILELSEDIFNFDEGCLSLPGRFANLKRSNKIKIRYTDSQNNQIIEEFVGISSICLQHEFDHLQGRIFIDYEIEKLNK